MLDPNLFQTRFSNLCPFHWRLHNLQLQIEWIERAGTIFSRPKNAPTDVLWTCGTNKTPFYKPDVADSFAYAFRNCTIWRCVELSERDFVFKRGRRNIYSYLHAPLEPRGHWPLGASFQVPDSFSRGFEKPKKCLLSPTNELVLQFRQLENAPESDFRSAKFWLQNYKDENSLFDWNNQWNEIEALLRAMIRLFHHFEDENQSVRATLFQRAPNQKLRFRSQMTPEKSPFPARLFETLNASFSPHFIKRCHQWAYGNWSRPSENSVPMINCEPPTNHEKLEAFLLWRDFLRGKIPESEIEFLLPKI